MEFEKRSFWENSFLKFGKFLQYYKILYFSKFLFLNSALLCKNEMCYQNSRKCQIKVQPFFISDLMKIWKSDILTYFSKSGCISLSKIDKVRPFLMYISMYICSPFSEHWFPSLNTFKIHNIPPPPPGGSA